MSLDTEECGVSGDRRSRRVVNSILVYAWSGDSCIECGVSGDRSSWRVVISILVYASTSSGDSCIVLNGACSYKDERFLLHGSLFY